MNPAKPVFLLLTALVAIAACQKADNAAVQESVTRESVGGKSLPDMSGVSPGKPSAPISMRYEIMSNPVVGQPVLINVVVSSQEGPVTVYYSITDRSALIFQDGQVERLSIVDPSSDVARQLTVVPQREGRLYVNVSAEVQTPGGSMIRSMAVPIKVGGAPVESTPNGEVVEGPVSYTHLTLPTILLV